MEPMKSFTQKPEVLGIRKNFFSLCWSLPVWNKRFLYLVCGSVGFYPVNKRNKAGADTEFEAKVSISFVDGVSFVDRISWDNFNEGIDLVGQIEVYRNRFGCYPKSVHADKIYRNRENRRYCKKHDIRLCNHQKDDFLLDHNILVPLLHSNMAKKPRSQQSFFPEIHAAKFNSVY